MARRFELVEGTSSKFWQIELSGASFTVTFGRLGTSGQTQLKLWIYAPPGHQPTNRCAAIVFFFGGGWAGGSPQQFAEHCRHLAGRPGLGLAGRCSLETGRQSFLRVRHNCGSWQPRRVKILGCIQSQRGIGIRKVAQPSAYYSGFCNGDLQ